MLCNAFRGRKGAVGWAFGFHGGIRTKTFVGSTEGP